MLAADVPDLEVEVVWGREGDSCDVLANSRDGFQVRVVGAESSLYLFE